MGYRPWGLELDMTERLSTRTHTLTSLDYFIPTTAEYTFFSKAHLEHIPISTMFCTGNTP